MNKFNRKEAIAILQGKDPDEVRGNELEGMKDYLELNC